MPTICEHDTAEKYISSQGYQRCHACDRITQRRGRGYPDDSVTPKVSGSIPELNSDGKICRDCKIKKPRVEFYKNRRNADGLQWLCIPCWKAKYSTSEYIRKSMLLRKYGITPEDYRAILDRQDGVCWICGAAPESQRDGFLSVDHSRKSGKVRGLLCNTCNLGIGCFRDDPELLEIAAAYLRQCELVPG